MDWDEEDCEAAPYADPNIRVEYEAALGRLILAHNEVDYRLAKALERLVLRLAPDRSLMRFATGTFETRVANLELFQKATPNSGAVQVDVTKLRELNKIRNDVAHGHFDQNPFDGSFTLKGDGKGKHPVAKQYKALALELATEELTKIASTLNAHEILGDFRIEFELPPGATRL